MAAEVQACSTRPSSSCAGRSITLSFAHRMPLYTTNPQDFEGLKELLDVVPVTRPA